MFINLEFVIVIFLLESAAIHAASPALLLLKIQLSINDSEFLLSSINPLIDEPLLSVKLELVMFTLVIYVLITIPLVLLNVAVLFVNFELSIFTLVALSTKIAAPLLAVLLSKIVLFTKILPYKT